MGIGRRGVLGGTGALALAARAGAQTPAAKPGSPLSVSIVDIAGNLALTQKAFEAYRREKPEMIGRFSFTKAPAPELPAKLRAQQAAGKVDIDMVLTGSDGLSAGIEQKIWMELLPAHQAVLPNLDQVLLDPAKTMQALAQGQGIIVDYCPGGPILEYMPDKVAQPPATADDLMAWCKAHPNRFMYARPANSGPGRAFMMGLPYILGDKDPKDPAKGWDKTWAYLAALDQYIEYYPTGTGPVFKELGDGTRDMVASHVGWDVNTRVLGIVPKEAKIALLKGTHFVTDAHYMCVPNGLAPEREAVLLDLVAYMLSKPAQAYAWDEGYFYPGPAVKDVPLSMAPKDSQAAIAEYGRPDQYPKILADTPTDTPLDAAQMVLAFRRWDEQVGGKKTK